MPKKPIPPVPVRAADDEAVACIDRMVELGVTQRKIARHFEIHYRTVSNIVSRKGAYASIPKR